ncbi:hypothetical protein BDV3_000362 [Batrachochytrium dendrobatidis]|nr:hypothetical protein O5D80_004659 [Batrachochytrium dendrobatidis]KAK5667846.1 hypothetical protein QVD99_004896 [Batrachochytrium dendrobatidis]
MSAGSLLWLMIMAICMFVGSFLAGFLPLAMSLSQERLRLISTFGSGLLVGTSLVVIIPEGTETLYSAASAFSASHPSIKSLAFGSDLSKEFKTAHLYPRYYLNHSDYSNTLESFNPVEHNSNVKTTDSTAHLQRRLLVRDDVPTTMVALDDGMETGDSDPKHSHNNSHHQVIQPHKYIGPSLLFGFTCMFLVDQVSSHSHPSRIVVSDLRDQHSYTTKKLSATIGLVVHAAADGIALGAASTSGADKLELIVFAAIMLHKAPSAFGLCTYLLQEGHSRRAIRQQLLIFSAAAPISAMITFLALFQADLSDPYSTQLWTGILLLFSAGTFLYVATIHVLPEIYQTQGSSYNHSEKSLSKTQIIVLLAGFITPMILAIEHHH